MAKQFSSPTSKLKPAAGKKPAAKTLSKSSAAAAKKTAAKKPGPTAARKSVVTAAKIKKASRPVDQMPLEAGADDLQLNETLTVKSPTKTSTKISGGNAMTATNKNETTDSSSDIQMNEQERQARIQTEAYHIAERDGFQPGREHEYWLQAEQQINSRLEEESRNHKAPLADRPKDVH